MQREELERTFDRVIQAALDKEKWTSTGSIRYGLVALAIAVRGLWPDTVPTSATKPTDERDFNPPVNQGGG